MARLLLLDLSLVQASLLTSACLLSLAVLTQVLVTLTKRQTWTMELVTTVASVAWTRLLRTLIY